MKEPLSEEERMVLLEKYFPVGAKFHDVTGSPEITLGLGVWEPDQINDVYLRIE